MQMNDVLFLCSCLPACCVGLVLSYRFFSIDAREMMCCFCNILFITHGRCKRNYYSIMLVPFLHSLVELSNVHMQQLGSIVLSCE